MTTILRPGVVNWPPEWYELWAERAAIIEFEARLPKEVAEKLAEQDIRRMVERGEKIEVRKKAGVRT